MNGTLSLKNGLAMTSPNGNGFTQKEMLTLILEGQKIINKRIDELHGKGTADKLMLLSKQTIKIENYELEEKHLFYKKNLITLRKQL